MTPEQLRERAARFYYKPHGITLAVHDWIEGREGAVAGMDPDVVDMATELSAIYQAGFTEGRKFAALVQGDPAQKATNK